MKQKQSISAAKKGMNRQNSPSQLTNLEVALAVNVNTNSETGDSINYQLEPSNFFGVRFPEGYKVIGEKTDILKDRTYYFLTNVLETNVNAPHYKRSSIGYVDYSQVQNNNFLNQTDSEDCDECNKLGKPLEDVVQTPSQTYVVLAHDRCIAVDEIEDKGFNFNINFPIKKIEIKQEKLGTTLYWNDWRNYFRYLQVGRIEEAIKNGEADYLHLEDIACETPTVTGCINVDKLRVDSDYNRIVLQAEKTEVGGNLKIGTYEFWAAYCDLNGSAITEYCTPTNPIPIWDENNYIQSQAETVDFTNYAIKIKIDNLDTKRYKYYKVAVVERNSYDRTKSVFLVGVFPTTDNVISYSQSASESLNTRLYFQELLAKKERYKRGKGTMVTDGRLVSFGLEQEEVINMQPIVNLFSGLVKAQTSVAKEGLYKSAIASSKYKQYTRNEVQPLAIRLLLDNGSTTPNYPFISRPKNSYDAEIIGENDLNKKSLSEDIGSCIGDTRNQRWQIYNTAEEIEASNAFQIDEQGIDLGEEDIEKTCVVDILATIPANTTTIEIDAPFYDLATYINENTTNIPQISPYLVDNYSETCTPYFQNNCTPPQFVTGSNKIIISEIQGETSSFIYKDLAEYDKITPLEICNIFERKDGGYKRDKEFEDNYTVCRQFELYTGGTWPLETYQTVTEIFPVFIRKANSLNEDCLNAKDMALIEDITQPYNSTIMNYAASEDLSELLSKNINFTTPITSTVFKNSVHSKARFFRIKKKGRNKILFEITKPVDDRGKYFEMFSMGENTQVRYNIYDKCSSPIHLGGGIVDIANGFLTELDVTSFPSTFLIVIDCPIFLTYMGIGCNTNQRDVHVITPPFGGCFGVYQRNQEPKKVNVSWTKILLKKEKKYTSSCTQFLPKLNDCDPVPYKKYKTAYWESTEEYPDNKELYDSSGLNVGIASLNILDPTDIKDFLEYYTTASKLTSPHYFTSNKRYFILQKGNELSLNLLANKIASPITQGVFSWSTSAVYVVPTIDENVVLKENTDFTCSPIRHAKMPDNTIAPFVIDTISYKKSADSIIFPMGINFDSKIVGTIIDVAYNNKYLTKKQKESIVGWEILKGDNSIHKSVIASGILYDVNKYSKDNQEIHFSNFPFNDLGENKFIVDDNNKPIKHKENSNRNNYFTFISPDMLLTKPTIPSEMVMQGFLMGTADVSFSPVKEHPQWTILGRNAYDTANDLANIEFILETAIAVAELSKETSIFIGAGSNGGNIGGAIAAGLIAGVSVAEGYAKKGKNRYEWLKIFRDLSRSDNFAYFQHGVGKHNKMLKVDNNSADYTRKLSIRKHLNEGDYTFVDEANGDEVKLNHTNRENSVFLSVGKHYVNYPSEYKNHDNGNLNSESSNFTASDAKNSRNIRDVANPYVHLKNYIPNQWNGIDSIKWLTTNYIFNLDDNTSNVAIYGGTQVISRFSWRVKVPLFTVDAIETVDKQPFLYSRNSNIAKTRYYCDYETADDSIFSYSGIPFPDIKSAYSLDDINGEGDFYLKPPSKFYLFTHGIIDFLVESEINCNFRYGKKEPENSFYRGQDLSKWLQQVNLPISEPNTFFYNNIYSAPVSNSSYSLLNRNYNKDIWKKIAIMENAWVWSEKDTTENDLIDPWLMFKPLNYKEESTANGKLIDLKSIESGQFLGRFENQLELYNKTNPYSDAINRGNIENGTGILYENPMAYKSTALGFAGTQNTDIISTPFGHYWVDAKRGKIFNVDQNGGNIDIISEGNGMDSWFREHLPFKILKHFPKTDTDNKYKGLGINMWWDDKENRVFVTKKDYIPINFECLKQDEDGFYTECFEPTTTCPEGRTFNVLTQKCEGAPISTLLCPTGYTYNSSTNSCVFTENAPHICCPSQATGTVFVRNYGIDSGTNTYISLSGGNVGTTFTWVGSGTTGVTGFSSGAGNLIFEAITGDGTVTYTITPHYNGCSGEPIIVNINVTTPVVGVPICADRRVVFQICNSNSATDDNFEILLNGTVIGQVDLNADALVGSVFIADLNPNIVITGADFTCPISNMVVYRFDPSLLQTTNTIFMRNIQNNHNGNQGIFEVRNYLLTGNSLATPCVVSNREYIMSSGENATFTFNYTACCS